MELEVPVERISWFRRMVLAWYGEHRRDLPWRREGATPYEQVVSEVFLQQTPAERVAAFLPAFVRRFPTWEALAVASETDLEGVLRPLGLWRRRAVALRALAHAMSARAGVFPGTREEIEQLPAVGQYVASAVLLFYHREPEPLLDVNMTRVLERFFGARTLKDIRHDPYLQALARAVVASQEAVSLNWAILDFAAAVCRARVPACDFCPLRPECRHANSACGHSQSNVALPGGAPV